MTPDLFSQDYLSLLSARRETVEAIMAHYLTPAHADPAEEEKSAAHLLLGIVLDGFDGAAEAPTLDQPFLRRHASRFGDGLTPVLKDVLGPDVPDAFISQCVDRYWRRLKTAIFA